MSIEIPQDIVEMNQEILSALKADEVDLSRKYTVEHHFSSSNFTLLEKLAVELFQAGFFCFDALKLCRISDETISGQQQKIFELLQKFHVSYDGWGVDTTVYEE